jgi:hypothetical protein
MQMKEVVCYVVPSLLFKSCTHSFTKSVSTVTVILRIYMLICPALLEASSERL